MKLVTKLPGKGRFDLHDFSNLDDVRNFGLKPYEEEWRLAGIVPDRTERTTFFGVNSFGEFCHIDIVWAILDSDKNTDEKRVLARATIRIKIADEALLTAVEEEIIFVESLKNNLENGRLKKFRIGKMSVEICRPFCRARLLFRGFVTDPGTSKKRFMKLNLFSAITTNVFDNLTSFCFDFMRKQQKGKHVYCTDSFEQWTQLKGQVEFESSHPRDVYFWGLNLKSFEQEPMSLVHFYVWNERGESIHLVGVENSQKDHIFGNINSGLAIIMPLEELPEDIKVIDDITITEGSKVSFKSPKANKVYEIEFLEKPIDFGRDLQGFPAMIQGHKAYGLVWKQHIGEVSAGKTVERPLKKVFGKNSSLVVSLDDESAMNEQLTGGKGSSLAVLKKFSKTSGFSVPDGIVLTVEAFHLFIDSHPDLKASISERLVRIVETYSNNSEKVYEECEQIQLKLKKHELPEELIQALKAKFDSIFLNPGSDSFAVRSSAVGEDSEEMSAAGQMTTFLGVRDFRSVCESVKACWASQFSMTAIEYKRGYGQPLNSPMAVVVQQMISSEVAGVMFTCSPITGNERLLTITASYGLGESVVSGIVEPDTFTVAVDGQTVIDIENVVLGDKKTKMEIGEQPTTTFVDDDQRSVQCLTNEQVLHLARIGLDVHSHYRSARDIEFAYSGEAWHLLQARPVTNLELLSEWEIFHELDTGHQSENEVLSRYNVGEVFPGASSYLVYDFLLRGWNTHMFASFEQMGLLDRSLFCPYTNLGFHSAYNTIFFSSKSFQTAIGRKNADKTKFQEGMQLTFRGYNDLDKAVLEEVLEKLPRMSSTLKQKMTAGYKMTTSVLRYQKQLKKAHEKFADYRVQIDFEASSSLDIWNVIMENIPIAGKAAWIIASATPKSMLYNSTLYWFLATKTGIKDQIEVLDLFARITSSVDDVFSAKVPAILQEIASGIANKEHFLALSDENALQHLRESNEKFRKFIQDYGHRGLKEFDIGSQTWEMNPIPLVQSIKSMLTSGSELKEHDKSFDLSKYLLSWFQRKILEKLIIPRARRGIRNRERGKNHLIRIYHEYRKLFYALADKMVLEGKLPQRELLFHMTMIEIEDLFHKPSPSTFINARNRVRTQAKKESLRFNEDTFGYEIKPRNLDVSPRILEDSTQLSGMPISPGRVVARCCVAQTIEDARHIQKGDILITYSTDIGWSPYFGAISGLVTEIGGLMSHGATIAREYGLPCLVGVNQATMMFQSGDTLLLDTTAGTVSKVQPEADK